MLVIEMNPRVSRSSLSRPRHRFPIAKWRQARVATRSMSSGTRSRAGDARVVRASIDYISPRCALRVREIPQANDRLTTQMKSVGEVMAIGRTSGVFPEGAAGLEWLMGQSEDHRPRENREGAGEPGRSASVVGDAFENDSRSRNAPAHAHRSVVSRADQKIVDLEMDSRHASELDAQTLRMLKRKGFPTGARVPVQCERSEVVPRGIASESAGVQAGRYLRGGIRDADAYMYSTYEEECEPCPLSGKK